MSRRRNTRINARITGDSARSSSPLEELLSQRSSQPWSEPSAEFTSTVAAALAAQGGTRSTLGHIPTPRSWTGRMGWLAAAALLPALVAAFALGPWSTTDSQPIVSTVDVELRADSSAGESRLALGGFGKLEQPLMIEWHALLHDARALLSRASSPLPRWKSRSVSNQ
jgi:hypothetical protein